METAVAAYRTLVALALTDGRLDARERELLERYRNALGIPPGTVDLRSTGHAGEISPEMVSGSPEERRNVVRMVARVAYADGALTRREHRRLRKTARVLGIGRFELANILEGVAHELHVTRRIGGLSRTIFAVGVLSLAAVLLSIAMFRSGFQGRTQAGNDVSAAFKAIEREYGRSVLFIVTRYTLVKGSEERRRQSTGTGFFVAPDGLIVTNKHVIEPWKFSPDVAQLLATGWKLDSRSVRIAAWPAGAVLLDDGGDLEYATAFDSRKSSLRVLRVPPDDLEERAVRLSSGETWKGTLHALDNADLALLKAEPSTPVRPFRVLPADGLVEKLDPVLVLGFPTGVDILEGRTAETSPSTGAVRKVEDTIYMDASVMPGNSGGPALNMRGEVIGVATRRQGEATLGCCIRSRALLSLLPSSAALIERAEASLVEGDHASAAAWLELARACGASPGSVAALEKRLPKSDTTDE